MLSDALAWIEYARSFSLGGGRSALSREARPSVDILGTRGGRASCCLLRPAFIFVAFPAGFLPATDLCIDRRLARARRWPRR